MKRVAVFDFDGTITEKDTLLEFLLFTHGWKYYLFLFLLSPVLVAFKLGWVRNDKAKEILFSFFYKGWRFERFTDCCNRFAKTIRTRPAAMEAIRQHQEQGDEILIVSASMENWIFPWIVSQGIDQMFATRIDVEGGKITGRFVGRNCYGPEKVNRLMKEFPVRTAYYIIAYGDSKGDRELLDYADEGYMQRF